MAKTQSKTQLIALLKEASEVFKVASKKAKILSALAWKPEVAEEFFRNKESALPKPTYNVDKKSIEDCIEALKKFEPRLAGDHPVKLWLKRTHQSYVDGCELLLSLETDRFYELSTKLYGNSQTRFFNGQTSNLDLAKAISTRLSVGNVNDIGESVVRRDTQEFAASLEARLKDRNPPIPVRVEVTDQIVAKVVAGMNRVRIRKDAHFSDLELSALWNHEIESHCLTAHNGASHENCDFLQAGGPRTTMTQEGLAVFFEVYGHTMSQPRFLSLCHRMEASHIVEQGGDFMQLYRWYQEKTDSSLEAFYATQRVFRGAKLSGGGPFTKDTVYLAGLLGVYNFLRFAAKNQNRLLVESLLCGRIALEDAGTIAYLRVHGIINPPKFVPDWLSNWEALLSFFSLSALLGTMDLSGFQSYFDDYYTLENWDIGL